MIGLVGGCGGAGASTLSVALALTALLHGDRALVLDADPLGGGLDLLLAAEDQPGLRWPDLSSLRGPLPPGLLTDGLPHAGLLPFLTWPRAPLPGRVAPWSLPAPSSAPPASFPDPFLTDPAWLDEPLPDLPPEPAPDVEPAWPFSAHDAVPGPAFASHPAPPPDALTSLLAAARAELDLVVVDLPRFAPAETVAHLDALVLVVPATLRATAAARALLTALPPSPNPHVVVRTALEGLPPEAVADALGLPLTATLRTDPRLPDALAEARTPGAATTATCRRLLEEVARDLA